MDSPLPTMPTDHLDDETTFCFVRLILNVALAPFHCCFFVPYISDSTLEHGQKGLPVINASVEMNWNLRSLLCCTIDM